METSFAKAQAARNARQLRSYVKMSPETWVQHIASTPQESSTSEEPSMYEPPPEPNAVQEDVPIQHFDVQDGPSSGEVVLDTQEQPATSQAVDESKRVSTAGLYLELPSSLEIRETKTTGRGLWAKETIKAGGCISA